MDILLVEDEDPKRRHIVEFLRDVSPESTVRSARSVRSALEAIVERTPDLVLLDMSLPTFDIGGTERGGRPQGFGGLELIRNMELEEIICPVVVITGYDAFTKAGGQVGLDALNSELAADHPEIFRAMLHFNSAYGDWKDRLRKLLLEHEAADR